MGKSGLTVRNVRKKQSSAVGNMIEYPTISNSSKAPRKHCMAFKKYDGSNIRAKWTAKKGFDLFCSRQCLIDETHPHLSQSIAIFKERCAAQLDSYFRSEKDFRHEKEIVVFSEFFGPNSFAGLHVAEDPKELVVFDIMLIRKPNPVFLLPQDFHKRFSGVVRTSELAFTGNLSDQFIADVRAGNYGTGEGLVCKGTEKSGAYRGGVWMCKIKTQAYFDLLKKRFDKDWEKYGE